MNFDEFFKQACSKRDDPGFGPFQYQRRLAEEPWPKLLKPVENVADKGNHDLPVSDV